MTENQELTKDIVGALFSMATDGFLKNVRVDVEHDFDALRVIGGPPQIICTRTMISTTEKVSIEALAAALLEAGWTKSRSA